MENLKKIWQLLTKLKPRFVILIIFSLTGTIFEMIGISMFIPIRVFNRPRRFNQKLFGQT